MSLYAQHGYGKSNKIENSILAGDISGVILGPKAESPDKILELAQTLHSDHPEIKIYFDPQFYICGLQGEVNSGKLVEYPYYVSGLTRASLSVPSNLRSYAESVINFQASLQVTEIFSPTIEFANFNGRESQTVISLAYESIALTDAENNLYISLCIHENAFNNRDEMEEFLNVISLLDVKGFYIIIERSSNTDKSTAIKANILSNIMHFIYMLSEINGFEVIMGYSDFISIPISAVGHSNFACGWYNNLKMFAEANFRPSTGGRRPRKRYTSGILMNSLLLVPEISTLNRMGVSNQIMTESPFNNIVYPTLDDVAWTDEISCRHNWHVLNNLLCEIENQGSVANKLDFIIVKIMEAAQMYRMIGERIPSLDAKSNNSHLNMWLAAISDFRTQAGV